MEVIVDEMVTIGWCQGDREKVWEDSAVVRCSRERSVLVCEARGLQANGKKSSPGLWATAGWLFFPSAARSPQQGKPLGRNRHGATGGGARPRQSCGRPRATSSPRVPSFQGGRAQFQAETFNIDLDHTTQPPTAPLRLVYFYAPLLLGSISQLHCRIGSPLDAMKRIVGPSNPEGGAEEGSSISTPEQPSQNPETPDTPGTMGAKRTFLPPELVSFLTPSLQVGTGVGMSNPPCPLLWRQTRS